ncbi:hypothetical protein R3P38DRAFT_3568007 [Favolaschia claudopus]|uniref:Uncharacterized protein n=1 Tax=Favolaschia claudopus TaxID=2862362 RepID=A0AAW0AT71_9AGAR
MCTGLKTVLLMFCDARTQRMAGMSLLIDVLQRGSNEGSCKDWAITFFLRNNREHTSTTTEHCGISWDGLPRNHREDGDRWQEFNNVHTLRVGVIFPQRMLTRFDKVRSSSHTLGIHGKPSEDKPQNQMPSFITFLRVSRSHSPFLSMELARVSAVVEVPLGRLYVAYGRAPGHSTNHDGMSISTHAIRQAACIQNIYMLDRAAKIRRSTNYPETTNRSPTKIEGNTRIDLVIFDPLALFRVERSKILAWFEHAMCANVRLFELGKFRTISSVTKIRIIGGEMRLGRSDSEAEKGRHTVVLREAGPAWLEQATLRNLDVRLGKNFETLTLQKDIRLAWFEQATPDLCACSSWAAPRLPSENRTARAPEETTAAGGRRRRRYESANSFLASIAASTIISAGNPSLKPKPSAELYRAAVSTHSGFFSQSSTYKKVGGGRNPLRVVDWYSGIRGAIIGIDRPCLPTNVPLVQSHGGTKQPLNLRTFERPRQLPRMTSRRSRSRRSPARVRARNVSREQVSAPFFILPGRVARRASLRSEHVAAAACDTLGVYHRSYGANGGSRRPTHFNLGGSLTPTLNSVPINAINAATLSEQYTGRPPVPTRCSRLQYTLMSISTSPMKAQSDTPAFSRKRRPPRADNSPATKKPRRHDVREESDFDDSEADPDFVASDDEERLGNALNEKTTAAADKHARPGGGIKRHAEDVSDEEGDPISRLQQAAQLKAPLPAGSLKRHALYLQGFDTSTRVVSNLQRERALEQTERLLAMQDEALHLLRRQVLVQEHTLMLLSLRALQDEPSERLATFAALILEQSATSSALAESILQSAAPLLTHNPDVVPTTHSAAGEAPPV